MSVWTGVSLTVGVRQWMEEGGTGLQEQPQGLKFPTPGVVLLFGLHLACMQEPQRSSDRHGIRQEALIVPPESMSLGLKVETNGLACSN